MSVTYGGISASGMPRGLEALGWAAGGEGLDGYDVAGFDGEDGFGVGGVVTPGYGGGCS